MNEGSDVFPFGTSIFFVYFLVYAIWLVIWRPKDVYGPAWKLASAAFFAGTLCAFTFATWIQVEGMLLGLLIINCIWTIINAYMLFKNEQERIAVIREQERLERTPTNTLLREMPTSALNDLVSRAYGIILERDINNDLQPATTGSTGATIRLDQAGQ